MSVTENLKTIKNLLPENVTLVAVSKTQSNEKIMEAYQCGQRVFGENYVQELVDKANVLPKDIEWHFIGHLQSNKVKYIAPFIALIHGVDSFKLLKEINKQAQKNNRTINCLLQIHIAKEETKFGLDENELFEILNSDELKNLSNINICGLMGMASNTDNIHEVKEEFIYLNQLFQKLKNKYTANNINVTTLSMGMSNDFQIAIECGSNMVRIGSSIFGARIYSN
ncbi:MAG: YggS family pyridoxal phosphate enzyme [Bacteroidia bacterium]|nr:MAG: YggS family pyridoxal phosphate enzyme [Bacteroidia bacterium]